MNKPEGYPLPWCEKFDTPYWRINIFLCMTRPGWAKKQAYVPMSEIIPWIDNLIENNELRLPE